MRTGTGTGWRGTVGGRKIGTFDGRSWTHFSDSSVGACCGTTGGGVGSNLTDTSEWMGTFHGSSVNWSS